MTLLTMSTAASAQWLDHPTADIPRLPDGKPNLAAPTPRTPDGKPQLAGFWRPSPGLQRTSPQPETGRETQRGPLPAVGRGALQGARANNSKDDPTATASSAACRGRTWSATRSRSSRCPAWSSSCTRPSTRTARSSPTAGSSPPTRARRGSATRSATGKATPSSSKPAGSTIRAGWTTRESPPPISCTSPTVRPQRLREPGHPDHDRRPEGLHAAVDRHATARVPGRHGAAGIHLQREQQDTFDLVKGLPERLSDAPVRRPA